MNYSLRQQKLQDSLAKEGLETLLVTHVPNVRYLCGFSGSAGVLAVTNASGKPAKFRFFTDGRYTEQAEAEVVGASVVIAKSGAMHAATEWIRKEWRKGRNIAVEADHMTLSERAQLLKLLPRGATVKETSKLVERLRMIKEAAEITQIRAAVQLASSVYDSVVGDIRPGVLESSIAAEIEYMCRRMGAERMAFETIVASGKRSALPHGVASTMPVSANGFVILDFGVILGGYCSDMTRTVHVGRPSRKAEKVYNAVLAAQLAGIKTVKPGVLTSEVDYAARKTLEKAGLGAYFTHSTGHGVGIEIHESPGIRKTPALRNKAKNSQPDRLETGMVVTIEPGVYIPGDGGVRIEDMVLVTEKGCEVLTQTAKDLITL